jgi:hypothetical protein
MSGSFRSDGHFLTSLSFLPTRKQSGNLKQQIYNFVKNCIGVLFFFGLAAFMIIPNALNLLQLFFYLLFLLRLFMLG